MNRTETNKPIYVNYGCGFSAPSGWMNFDGSPTLRFERMPLLGKLYTKNEMRFPDNIQYGDVVKGLPLPNNSADLVYCSHILEHLSLDDFRLAIQNTYKIMKPGAIFRLVVPDLKVIAKRYIESSNDDASIKFIKETLMGKERREKGVLARLKSTLANSDHLWMWDSNSLALELKNGGFSQIREGKFGDSIEKHFSEVENEDRFNDAVCMECIK